MEHSALYLHNSAARFQASLMSSIQPRPARFHLHRPSEIQDQHPFQKALQPQPVDTSYSQAFSERAHREGMPKALAPLPEDEVRVVFRWALLSYNDSLELALDFELVYNPI